MILCLRRHEYFLIYVFCLKNVILLCLKTIFPANKPIQGKHKGNTTQRHHFLQIEILTRKEDRNQAGLPFHSMCFLYLPPPIYLTLILSVVKSYLLSHTHLLPFSPSGLVIFFRPFLLFILSDFPFSISFAFLIVSQLVTYLSHLILVIIIN